MTRKLHNTKMRMATVRKMPNCALGVFRFIKRLFPGYHVHFCPQPCFLLHTIVTFGKHFYICRELSNYLKGLIF